MSQNIDGDHYFYHYDGFHNTRSLTDMNGAVTDSYRYDAYGTLLEQSDNTQNPYLYRSEQFDAETNSYYLRARSYQPGTGRFLSTDPVEGDTNVPKSLHRYLYAYNDPVNLFDPFGQFTLTEALTTVGTIGFLSTMGYSLGEVYEDVYYDLADQINPDAGVLGASVYLKVSVKPQVMHDVVDGVATAFKELFKKPSAISPISGASSLTGGAVLGAEALYSFGSSQLGFFWYWGLQGEAQISSNLSKVGIEADLNIYTGHVWNLWNCDDYTGEFMAINTPWFSRFWDPMDMLKNLGPWGYSRSILSVSGALTTKPPFIKKSSSSTLGGLSGTYYRYLGGDPTIVSYGKLAFYWCEAQAVVLAQAALRGKTASAFSTAFGMAYTGVIAKSKEIYNRSAIQTSPNPVQTLHTLRSSNTARSKEKMNFYRNGQFREKNYWRSGPRLAWGIFLSCNKILH